MQPNKFVLQLLYFIAAKYALLYWILCTFCAGYVHFEFVGGNVCHFP